MGSFTSKVEDGVKDRLATQMALQREIQMSINIAQARDSLMWYGSLYAGFVASVAVGVMARQPVPKFAAIPIVVGGFALGNIYDIAYGNKLQRVVAEAEYMLHEERHRFVPMEQAIFYNKYTDEEKNKVSAWSGRGVSTFWPSFFPMSRPPSLTSVDAEKKV
eukprot:CFRG7287T1